MKFYIDSSSRCHSRIRTRSLRGPSDKRLRCVGCCGCPGPTTTSILSNPGPLGSISATAPEAPQDRVARVAAYLPSGPAYANGKWPPKAYDGGVIYTPRFILDASRPKRLQMKYHMQVDASVF